jgi:hypothetical protein
MNERIEKLAEQCGFRSNPDIYDRNQSFDIEKFAELIVRECIDCLKPLSRNHSMVGAARDTIKEHFGVEE